MTGWSWRGRLTSGSQRHDPAEIAVVSADGRVLAERRFEGRRRRHPPANDAGSLVEQLAVHKERELKGKLTPRTTYGRRPWRSGGHVWPR